MADVIVSTQLRTFTCGECGGLYALGEKYASHKQEIGGFWKCPYCGCSWGYPKEGSKLEVAKRQAAESEARLIRERAAHDQTRAQLAATKTEAIKEAQKHQRLQKRIKAGVCPCCHRTFRQLIRHMECKHPEYVAK